MEVWLVSQFIGGDEFISAFDSEFEARREAEHYGGEVRRLSDYDKQGQADILDGGISYDYRTGKEVIH